MQLPLVALNDIPLSWHHWRYHSATTNGWATQWSGQAHTASKILSHHCNCVQLNLYELKKANYSLLLWVGVQMRFMLIMTRLCEVFVWLMEAIVGWLVVYCILWHCDYRGWVYDWICIKPGIMQNNEKCLLLMVSQSYGYIIELSVCWVFGTIGHVFDPQWWFM